MYVHHVRSRKHYIYIYIMYVHNIQWKDKHHVPHNNM